jgi:predicted HicB family RNase H-like nuclease
MKNQKIVTRKLLVRIPENIYLKMRHLSVETGISLNQYVIESFNIILDKQKKRLK